MNLSISNLAWVKKENKSILNFLKKKNINFIEFAPALLKNNHKSYSYANIKKMYSSKSLSLYSMQSLLYNKNNHYLYGTYKNKYNLLNEIQRKIKVAKKLNVKIMVFGSPLIKKNILLKNDYQLWCESVDFFNTIKKILVNTNILFCIEANPKLMGGDYINNTFLALKIIKKIKSKNIKLNLDYGTVIKNNENINKILTKENLKFIGHVHFSIPNLKNIRKYLTYFCKQKKLLKRLGYNKNITVEMLPIKINNTKNIEKILNNLLE